MMEDILYTSTRGTGTAITASQAILKGIAGDGGLFVPNAIPQLDRKISELKNFNYKETAFYIMRKFFSDFTDDELRECIESAYGKKFDTDEIAPVKKVGNNYVLELFHGPTLAFKDMALSILPYLMKTAVIKQHINKEIVILTATSGDTGKAALEGFSDVKGIKIVVFFPEYGVSEIQKRQMKTHQGNNTFVIGIKGNFDDAQSGVKNIFADEVFLKLMKENRLMFSSANSINIGRLIPQVAYYFHAYFQLLKSGEITENENINFAVPTGNFGNILAAYYAKLMGLPIDKLICASNENKVLYDFIETGMYDRNRQFVATISPSMDILISSNLERLLYTLSENDCYEVSKFMEELKYSGTYTISGAMKEKLNDFNGGYATEEETKAAIKEVFERDKYLMDTHTAVAYSVFKKLKPSGKTVIVSTASPYKFTKAVMGAVDKTFEKYDDFQLLDKMSEVTGTSIPSAIKNIDKREVLHNTVCDKNEMRRELASILNIKIV